MRIALVCPDYKTDRSYQENIWAEQLSKAGHEVRVISAAPSNSPVRRIKHASGTHELQEVATQFLPRSTYRCKTVHLAVREFKPELIVITGDKLYCLPVVRDQSLRHVPLISTYSENLGMHEFDWRKRGISLRQRFMALGFAALRGGPIRATCTRSDLIIGNTPQAREIILRLFSNQTLRAQIDQKIIDMPLGFSPDHFGFDPDMRNRVRAEIHLQPGTVLVCVSSHFSAVKAPFVKLIISALRRIMVNEPSLKALIVGFTDQAEYAPISAQIGQHIDSGQFADRFIKHPFAQRGRLCELYNASDIAAFGRASISCQEALGTGLFACFSDDGSLNHLVTMPEQGVFFRPNDEDDLTAQLAKGVHVIQRHQGPQGQEFRRQLAQGARWLGYDRIIAAILQEVADRRGAGAE